MYLTMLNIPISMFLLIYVRYMMSTQTVTCGSSLVVIKQREKYRFHAATMIFYIPQNICINKCLMLLMALVLLPHNHDVGITDGNKLG
jgi:hypothetical protein